MEDTYTTGSGREEVTLRIFVEKRSESADHAMTGSKINANKDEDVYGREYDLNIFMIVAVDDFNFGAMENKGLNIFNAALVLADPKTAADLMQGLSVIARDIFTTGLEIALPERLVSTKSQREPDISQVSVFPAM